MSRLLVTGGTGVLGGRVAARLMDRGHDVAVLTRRAPTSEASSLRMVNGELRSSRGLVEATCGVEAIVHCASSPFWRPSATEVGGGRNLIAAAEEQKPHLVYISIVGVDRIPYYYYRAKWQAEQVLEASALPWTILRATQFHSLIDRYAVGSLLAFPKGARAQPIDASEVAERLVELVDAGPSQRVADIGGPEILTVRELAALRREILGQRLRVLEMPSIGKVARAFRDGLNLAPEQAVGRITYADYLHSLTE
jgi:uncharacterized protein YbjT (DUF2867 family)